MEKMKIHRLFKRSTLLCLVFFGLMNTQNVKAQFTILEIDSISPMEPLVIGDTTDFYVKLFVDDIGPLNVDSLLGNLFYVYLTDSMINSGQLPRIIDLDLSVIWVPNMMADTVPIDIRPNEIRTEPANLIILWPAMINPLILDTNGININIPGLVPTLGLEYPYTDPNHQIIYPSPAIQFVRIRPEDVELIKEVRLLYSDGRTASSHLPAEFKSSGTINVDHLASGNYLVEIFYLDGNTHVSKIVKY